MPLTIFCRRLWPWPFDLGLPYSAAGYDHDLVTLVYHILPQAMTMTLWPWFTIFCRRPWPWPCHLGLPYSALGYDNDLVTLAMTMTLWSWLTIGCNTQFILHGVISPEVANCCAKVDAIFWNRTIKQYTSIESLFNCLLHHIIFQKELVSELVKFGRK